MAAVRTVGDAGLKKLALIEWTIEELEAVTAELENLMKALAVGTNTTWPSQRAPAISRAR